MTAIVLFFSKNGMLIDKHGADYPMTAGDALIVAGNESHEIFCRRDDTYVVLISFGYALLGNDYSLLQGVCFDEPYFHLKDTSEDIRQPLETIGTLLRQESLAPDWELRSCLYAIAAYLSRHTHIRGVSRERLLRTRQREKLQDTLQYIGRHFKEEITLAQAAAAAGYDTSYFCKLFRSATGMTFHRYLNEYRISVACRLLTRSEEPIWAVAEQAGFPTQKALNRLFRDIMGMTPSQYRKLRPEEKTDLQLL